LAIENLQFEISFPILHIDSRLRVKSFMGIRLQFENSRFLHRFSLAREDIYGPACVTVYPLRILAGVSSRRRRNAGRPPAAISLTSLHLLFFGQVFFKK